MMIGHLKAHVYHHVLPHLTNNAHSNFNQNIMELEQSIDDDITEIRKSTRIFHPPRFSKDLHCPFMLKSLSVYFVLLFKSIII